jgi:hypothetical protein
LAPFGSWLNSCQIPESFCRRRSYLTPAASKRAFTAFKSLAVKAMWSITPARCAGGGRSKYKCRIAAFAPSPYSQAPSKPRSGRQPSLRPSRPT